MSSETSRSIWETENKKLKRELTNLRSDLKGKDDYLKNNFEDRSRRNNMRVESIPGRKTEAWSVTKEKLRKVIKDQIDSETAVIECALMVKRNNDNNNINDQNRKPSTIVSKLTHFKDKWDICMKQNHIKS